MIVEVIYTTSVEGFVLAALIENVVALTGFEVEVETGACSLVDAEATPVSTQVQADDIFDGTLEH